MRSISKKLCWMKTRCGYLDDHDLCAFTFEPCFLDMSAEISAEEQVTCPYTLESFDIERTGGTKPRSRYRSLINNCTYSQGAPAAS